MNNNLNSKKWTIAFLITFMIILCAMAGIVVFVDPFFHYHKPVNGLQYPITIENERYENDGIVSNFNYDAIIAGTSMTELFKASELNELFGVNSIKVPHRGASYKEINDNLLRAFDSGNDIKLVVRSLDYSCILDGADTMNEEADTFPTYLYDNNIFNDVNYVLNMDILYDSYIVYSYTKSGGITTDFDVYGDWSALYPFGKEAVLNSFSRPEKSDEQSCLTDDDKANIEANINENVLAIAKQYPSTQFYLFITPYSIAYFDVIDRKGELPRMLDAEEYMLGLLMNQPNVHVFSFFEDTDIICNLDLYKDNQHYNADINSYILRCIYDGTHELTADNYIDYCNWEHEFFMNYNYDLIYE